MNSYSQSLLLICFLFTTNIVFGQVNDVDLERITPKNLKKSLVKTQLFMVDNIINLPTTCPRIKDSTHYFHNYTVYFDAPIDSVWNAYNTVSPTKVWNSKIISFGFAYARADNQLYYEDEIIDHLEVGQIQFLSLRYLGGIFKLTNALELTKIDENSKSLQFCYMRYGKSQGTQIIKLTEENGRTKVTHNTYYKSGSKFRDKRLYPYFHEITVKDLHENIGAILNN